MNYAEKLKSLLVTTAQYNASDLHISVGRPPTLRLNGELYPIEKEDVVTPEIAEGLVAALLDERQQAELQQNRQIDFSYPLDSKARFRVSAFYQQGYAAAALRLIPGTIRGIDDLGLPHILHDFAELEHGFVLVVGPSGQGKSTTLAAILDEINHTRNEHLITIEDPIEYLFTQDRCIVAQREVGNDTLNFAGALKTVLRQDPDIIMVGEMRDPESISTALTAAETGHLVFSTLHTNSAAQTVDRIIDTFPSEQQNQIASQLAAVLVAIVSQRLVPRADGQGLVAACEIMLANSAARNLIRERKGFQIDLVIETGMQEGMITLNHALASLVERGIVTLAAAESQSRNVEELRGLVKRKIK